MGAGIAATAAAAHAVPVDGLLMVAVRAAVAVAVAWQVQVRVAVDVAVGVAVVVAATAQLLHANHAIEHGAFVEVSQGCRQCQMSVGSVRKATMHAGPPAVGSGLPTDRWSWRRHAPSQRRGRPVCQGAARQPLILKSHPPMRTRIARVAEQPARQLEYVVLRAALLSKEGGISLQGAMCARAGVCRSHGRKAGFLGNGKQKVQLSRARRPPSVCNGRRLAGNAGSKNQHDQHKACPRPLPACRCCCRVPIPAGGSAPVLTLFTASPRLSSAAQCSYQLEPPVEKEWCCKESLDNQGIEQQT